MVLGLPRGGMPVAAQVARALHAPLDLVVVRKVGAPHQPELAMGAVGEGGVVVPQADVARRVGVTSQQFVEACVKARAEVDQQVQRYRGGGHRLPVDGRTALLVDDGIATGATIRAACEVVRAGGASRVVLAAPVGAADSLEVLGRVADEVVCLLVPEPFRAVGHWYDDFAPVSENEVVRLLEEARQSTR